MKVIVECINNTSYNDLTIGERYEVEITGNKNGVKTYSFRGHKNAYPISIFKEIDRSILEKEKSIEVLQSERDRKIDELLKEAEIEKDMLKLRKIFEKEIKDKK
jgi:hypothetical protein